MTKNDEFIVQGESTFIYINYPEKLDFTSSDSLTIEYYLKDNYSFENIKLNPESKENLECEQNLNLIKCNVTKNHFSRKTNGYYYTYHLNNLSEYTPSYFTNPIKVILPIQNEFPLYIKKEYNNFDRIIGQNGTIAFITDYNDIEFHLLNNSFLEENTTFQTSLIDEVNNEIYNVSCRLWNPIGENLVIICNLKENLKYDAQNISLNNIIFNYIGYNISIYSETSVNVKQYNYNIPFIYSDKQIINISDNINLYELKFKYDSYNNDILYLSGISHLSSNFILDNCKIESKELICNISKEKIESILSNDIEEFYLESLNDNYGVINYKFVYNINIKYEIKKEDIYVKITKLLNNVSESGNVIAYDTNISSINNLHSSEFKLKFNNIGEQNCYFKKNNKDNLLILCQIITANKETYLEKIDNEITLRDIHYKYIFKIQPGENKERIMLGNEGTLIEFVYPEILNFSSIDLLTIRYKVNSPLKTNNIKLYPDSPSELSCKNLNSMKICNVSVQHFTNKKNGYYYTYHLNHLDKYSIYYDANPINIIFHREIEIVIEEKDNKNLIKIGNNGTLYLVTNYNDTNGIFDSNQLDSYYFIGNFSDNISNIYEPNCRLWKPLKENLRLICKFNESLKIENQTIDFYINNITFNYTEDIKIIITSKAENIKVKQLTTNISFLYSDKQTINIEDNTTTYNISFKQELYDNMPLYLYKNDIKAIKLDNCLSENNELNCNINKDKLLEILSYSGESFYLAEKHNKEGLYIIPSVLNITFNYQKNQKDIDITIGKLLTKSVAKNEFIAYETNITNIENISIITTDYFNIKQETNEVINCIFKNNENKNNLLLLCNATNEGEYSLGNIKQTTLDKINIHYKFNLQESENNDVCNIINEEGAKITSVDTLELNFTEKDSYMIKYEIENPEKIKGIKLNNESSSELNCSNNIWYKECLVEKNHFTKSGIYYTHHIIDQNIITISYEVSPIKVILKEINPSSPGEGDKDSYFGAILGTSIAVGLVVLFLISLLIWKYFRKKDIQENQEKIIEENNEENNEKKNQNKPECYIQPLYGSSK